MKKKRLSDVSNKKISKEVINKSTPAVIKDGSNYFFETGNITTYDVAEAVSIFMKKIELDDVIWQMGIDKIPIESVSPEKALYWLSGGDSEWLTKSNYKLPWKDCKKMFSDEFGSLILDIISESKYLYEIRDAFMLNINLLIIYEFALDKGIIN